MNYVAKRFLQVVDHFYGRPLAVRQRALSMQYSEPDGVIGWRTKVWQPPYVKRLFKRAFRIDIEYWGDDTNELQSCNGVFFTAFSSGKHSENVKVHFDEPSSWVSLLVYLTPGAPYDAGTSFWRHRATGLTAKPTKQDASRLRITLTELTDLLERDGWHPNRWTEIDRVGNVFNRALVFRAGSFHSATRHFGSNLKNGRLYQSFHFPMAR